MWLFFFFSSWKKIKYFGHIIDKDGKRSHPKQAAAIKDMLASDNIASLQSFLGLANYYQVFILPDIGPAVRVFASGPGDLGSIPGRVIPKTQKMVLDASLLNTPALLCTDQG